MSLAVARTSGDAVVIAADLRVTDKLDIRRGYPFGVLKAVTISPSLCVAFAGLVDPALEVVRAVAIPDPSFTQTLRRLADLTPPTTDPETPEYLLVGSDPPRIARIRPGSVEDGLLVAHIGDKAAFERYQALSREVPPPTSIAGRQGPVPDNLVLTSVVTQAFGQLIREGAIPTVGEASVHIVAEKDRRLHYYTSAIAYPPPQLIPPNRPTPIQFGSAAQGGFAYTILTPRQPGPGAIGLYFPQGALGLLYYPVKDRHPLVYARVTHDGFREGVLRDHGFDIQGLMFT